ncbi:MAG TPA: hypothetical protein V6D19_00535 [Stenomitos sp.]
MYSNSQLMFVGCDGMSESGEQHLRLLPLYPMSPLKSDRHAPLPGQS